MNWDAFFSWENRVLTREKWCVTGELWYSWNPNQPCFGWLTKQVSWIKISTNIGILWGRHAVYWCCDPRRSTMSGVLPQTGAQLPDFWLAAKFGRSCPLSHGHLTRFEYRWNHWTGQNFILPYLGLWTSMGRWLYFQVKEFHDFAFCIELKKPMVIRGTSC